MGTLRVVTLCLTTGICSEQRVIRWPRHRANIIEDTHTDLDGTAYCTPQAYASLLPEAAGSYRTPLPTVYSVKSTAREDGAVRRGGERGVWRLPA